MPNRKISALNPTATFDGTELIPIVQDGETVYTTLANLAAHIVTEASYVPIDLPYRGARVRLASDLTPGSSGFSVIPWGIEDRDTDNFWSIGQPTRFVIPAGVTKVRLGLYLRSPSGASGRYAFFKKNGDYVFGGGGVGQPGNAFDLSLSSDAIDVVVGDYFEVEIFGSTSNLGAGISALPGLGCWFSLEVRELA